MGVFDRIETVESAPAFFKLLVYGPPGAGKTVFGARAPSPLLLDVDNGWVSLKNHQDTLHTPKLPIRSSDELEEFVWDVRQSPERYEDFETFFVDTATELEARMLTETVKFKVNQDPTRKSAYLPHTGDYKENGEHLRRIFIALMDLPKHIIVSCHEKEDKDEATSRYIIRPALAPKVAQTIRGLVDIQAHLTNNYSEEKGEYRTLQLINANGVQAKTRIGGLDPIIENPTFQMLFDAFELEQDNENKIEGAVA